MTNKKANGKPATASASHIFGEMRYSPERIKDLFRNGTYPYKSKIRNSAYEEHKEELQVELLKVQNWVKLTGQRIVVLFEGRDAAGKGGTIKRFSARASIACSIFWLTWIIPTRITMSCMAPTR